MNKVAFITGAGGYIGGETALTLAKSGINVAVCDINEETVKNTVDRIVEIGGTAFAIDIHHVLQIHQGGLAHGC